MNLLYFFPPFLPLLPLPAVAAQNFPTPVFISANSAITGAVPFPTDICAFDAFPDGPGDDIVAQFPDDELTDILNQIDPVRIQAIIEKLVSFGTRSTMSVNNQTVPGRGIAAARDWLLEQYQGFAEASDGFMTVTVSSRFRNP